jgi:hypothetical protein
MALARVKTWVREVLTFADQNAEFDNILNNALSLISPLTGNLAAGDNDLTGLDELHFTDAVAGATAAGRLRRNSTMLTWHDGTAARNLLTNNYTGAITLVSGGLTISANGLTINGGTLAMGTSLAIVPGATSSPPTAHGLFRENVVKGWARITVAGGVPAITDSFNVSSITDTGLGTVTVTWDRDFANDDYVCVCSCSTPFSGAVGGASSHLVGSNRVVSINSADPPGPDDPEEYHVIAIGDQ